MLLQNFLNKAVRKLKGSDRSPAILMYHRVADVQYDPWDLAVSPETFEQQLLHLTRNHVVMPLDDLIQGFNLGKLPRSAVAVTFDDGYRDNLLNAKPLLAAYRIPATVFLTTGTVGSTLPYWWDELAQWMLGSVDKVDHLEVIDGEEFHIVWGEPEPVDLNERPRGAFEPGSSRQETYLRVWTKLRATSQTERMRAMDSLRRVFPKTEDELLLPMDQTEVRELASGGLITLGAHTVNHPALTGLPEQECSDEIVDSINQCEHLIGVRPSAFAYPYGDMNPKVRNIVAESGLSSACSTQAAHLDTNQADLYALPRLAIRNTNLEEFAAAIR